MLAVDGEEVRRLKEAGDLRAAGNVFRGVKAEAKESVLQSSLLSGGG